MFSFFIIQNDEFIFFYSLSVVNISMLPFYPTHILAIRTFCIDTRCWVARYTGLLIPLLDEKWQQQQQQKCQLTWVFKAALLIITKKYKFTKCPSCAEWINKMWNILAREYYSAIKGNKVLMHTIAWISLRSIMLSEKATHKRSHIIWNVPNSQIQRNSK